MWFLEGNEIEAWCAKHNIAFDDRNEMQPNPALTHSARAVYAESGRSGREPGLAAACAKVLGEWSECLLWVQLWGIWPSSEDWPNYYAMRGVCGEQRSLEVAPGHLFASDERDTPTQFLTVMMENAWDTHAFAARDGAFIDAQVFVSHDGWMEVSSSSAVSLSDASS